MHVKKIVNFEAMPSELQVIQKIYLSIFHFNAI